MDLNVAMRLAASGMKVQSARLRTTAENLANAELTGASPGAEPFRRKTISFGSVADRGLGVDLVDVTGYGTDPSDFEMRHEPGHPAADANGYVKYPNVQPLAELSDMREAQRSYEANLKSMELARSMLSRTLDLLR